MEILELARLNLLSPVVLAFVLGAVATWVRSDLEIPPALYLGLSIYLLFAIGLKGGAALAVTPLTEVWGPVAVTVALGAITPLIAYAILRRLGRFGVADSAALAAHYGSVSVVTFLATTTFLDRAEVPYEGFVPALVALLEVPAIVVALLLAHTRLGEGGSLGEAVHEVLAGKSVLLLLGGLAVGWVSGPQGFEKVEPFFVTPFQGVLALFLLELGRMAAKRLGDLRRVGLFLLAFALLMPIFQGCLGVLAGSLVGMSLGGATILGVLVASASYIAAPAAVRIALPQANPSFYLTASLAITFPFNLTVGIPLLYGVAQWLYAGG